MVLVSVDPPDLVEAEEESYSLILGGLKTEEAGGLKTFTPQGDLQVRLRSGLGRSQVSAHLGSRARLLPGVLGALIVAAVASPPVPSLVVLAGRTDIGDSSVLIEVTVRRNILGELIRALVRKPEKEGEETSSWLSLPCRRVCLRGEKVKRTKIQNLTLLVVSCD